MQNMQQHHTGINIMTTCKYCNNNAIGEFITFPDAMQNRWELLCIKCSNESAVIYIISQLNIILGKKVYDISSNEDESMVSFKYNGVNFSIREWYHSRGYSYWVVDVE